MSSRAFQHPEATFRVSLRLGPASSVAPDWCGRKTRRRHSRPGANRHRPCERRRGLDILRGEYGRYRANNDLLHYDLDIRVDPEKKFISGKNTIR